MTKIINPPCVVSIAGTDPSGGAGIQADIKSISAVGGYAASIITVLVSQNTQGVQSVYSISLPDFVRAQINSVFKDLKISAVKIGMLYSKEIIEVVASAMEEFKPNHIVLDPVIIAKDDTFLLNLVELDLLKQKTFPLANLITPNLFEVGKIMNQEIKTLLGMEKAAKELGEQYKTNILIKGGHFKGDNSSDVLYLFEKEALHWFHSKRIKTHNTHGTGCTLSAAIATYLAQHYSLIESINHAKLFLTNAIRAGSKIQIGKGCGPVDHFYFLRESK